ncbi:MAG TPA: hypothetical protein VE134_01735, partial [Methanomicrobiales archaeon]|nr:hypothetical protein [Methanomicrobiales archaeon]
MIIAMESEGYLYRTLLGDREKQSEMVRLWLIGAFAIISLLVTLYAVSEQGEAYLHQVYYLIPH